MSGLNKIFLIGNLARTPMLLQTSTNLPVCKLSVGVTEKRKKGEDWENHTEWFSIVTFNKLAKNCVKYLTKGRQIYIEGRLQCKKWIDQDGYMRINYEILANQVLFLGGLPIKGSNK